MSKFINLVGQTFSRLKVVGINSDRKVRGAVCFFVCQCVCGNTCEVMGQSLRSGRTKSCGCFAAEVSAISIAKAHKPPGNTHFNFRGHGEMHMHTFLHYKKGAEERNLAFEISIEAIWNLYLHQDRKCALTGLEITLPKSLSHAGKKAATASLDRIDSSKGYVGGNLQWVHKIVNKMKNNIPCKTFVEFCGLVHNNSSLGVAA